MLPSQKSKHCSHSCFLVSHLNVQVPCCLRVAHLKWRRTEIGFGYDFFFFLNSEWAWSLLKNCFSWSTYPTLISKFKFLSNYSFQLFDFSLLVCWYPVPMSLMKELPLYFKQTVVVIPWVRALWFAFVHKFLIYLSLIFIRWTWELWRLLCSISMHISETLCWFCLG